MIDKVILYDIKCGKNYISTLEARQILGRAGRTYNKFEQGQTYIFCKEDQLDKANQYYYGDDNTVNSNLIDVDMISFHILPDILNNKIKSILDIKIWFEHTLSFVQGNNIDENKIYQHLIHNECIDQNFNITQIGKLSISYYYSPNRIKVLKEKLLYLLTLEDYSLMSFAWVFSYYKGQNKIFHPLYELFSQQVSSKYYLNGQFNDFFTYYLILNNKSIKKIGSLIGKTRKDFSRLLGLTKKLSKIINVNIDKYLKLIETMLYYRVSIDGAQLMHDIDCYDVNIIRKLLQIQVHNYKQLEYNIDFINNFFESKISDVCNKIVQERQNEC